MPPDVVAVLGPTAVGKSNLAIRLAQRFRGEIINCDSTAVYRGFDIGTDKLMPHERRGIPHHLIDIVAPTEVYTAARFATDAAALIDALTARGVLPIVVGGGASAKLKGGRHIKYAEPTPMANLHLTLLDKVGVKMEKFADSKGKVDELLAL